MVVLFCFKLKPFCAPKNGGPGASNSKGLALWLICYYGFFDTVIPTNVASVVFDFHTDSKFGNLKQEMKLLMSANYFVVVCLLVILSKSRGFWNDLSAALTLPTSLWILTSHYFGQNSTLFIFIEQEELLTPLSIFLYFPQTLFSICCKTLTSFFVELSWSCSWHGFYKYFLSPRERRVEKKK